MAPEDHVVEIGCGVGRITRELANRCAIVDALDVSESMLDLARQHNAEMANVQWLLGDGSSLAGIADSSADVCFSHVVFQHIPYPAITYGYVSEMGRVLRGGGWAVFQVSNLPLVHKRQTFAKRLGGALSAASGRGPKGQDHPAWRGSAIDLDELTNVSKAADMRVEKIAGAGTQFCIVHLQKQAR